MKYCFKCKKEILDEKDKYCPEHKKEVRERRAAAARIGTKIGLDNYKMFRENLDGNPYNTKEDVWLDLDKPVQKKFRLPIMRYVFLGK